MTPLCSNHFCNKRALVNYMLALVFSWLLIGLVKASLGDERESFLGCLKECIVSGGCKLTSLLRWTAWDCEADCKYNCMRSDLATIRAAGERVVQYYGKWPFIRIFGAQEVFSVVFSLGNLAANLYGFYVVYQPAWKKLKPVQRKTIAYVYRLHVFNLMVACNAWLQSAIFHYRDTWITERLDYFSACLLICSTLPMALILTGRVTSKRGIISLFLVMAAVYLQHIYYMAFVLFDYGYNIKFNSVIGVLTKLVWISWIWRNYRTKLGKKMTTFIAASAAVTLMVAVDFPAWWDLIDMHALWHLATIPVTIMWYDAMKSDLTSRIAKNK